MTQFVRRFLRSEKTALGLTALLALTPAAAQATDAPTGSTSAAAHASPTPMASPTSSPTASNGTPAASAQTNAAAVLDAPSEKEACLATLKATVRKENQERLAAYCENIQRLPSCMSVEKRPIHHMTSSSQDPRGKRILVLGMIHGDEPLAGEMALEWATRLKKIDHRNDWRVVAMLNPDGLERKSRLNAHGVDLNRNFPTRDWNEEAVKFWERTSKSDPRRFPGDGPASEPETKCAIAHIKDFKPDFIVSIHTPYKVLDFDGPRMIFPAYRDLPWRALGNFPGSLGRYMWKDYSIPVLTVELGQYMVDSYRLQDIVGGFAIEASRRSGTKTAGLFDLM